MELSFKKWLETAQHGGVEPPKQDPTKVAQGAIATYHSPGSEELPPTKANNFKMKKKMKKKS